MDLGFAFRRRQRAPDLVAELGSLLGSHGARQAITTTAQIQATLAMRAPDDTRIDLFSARPGGRAPRLADAQFAHIDSEPALTRGQSS